MLRTSNRISTKKKNMDTDIMTWTLEFLLRQQCVPDSIICGIMSDPHTHFHRNSPRLQMAIVLRSIDSEISDGSVSETILDSLETLEQVYRQENIHIVESMKLAYSAVAVHCTLRCLWGNLISGNHDKYRQSVNRILVCRIQKLEEVNSELVSDELKRLKEEIEALVLDSGDVEKWKGRNTAYDAFVNTGAFVKEAMDAMGPSIIERVHRAQIERTAVGAATENLEEEAGIDRDTHGI